jgi:adenine-specific DNA-methyltransferase
MEGLQQSYITQTVKGKSPLKSLEEHARLKKNKACTKTASTFPKTRYYGSKLRIVDWLEACTSDLQFNTALDAFGGTATVSLMLKNMAKHVTYNDALTSNQYVAKALLHQERKYVQNEITSFFGKIEPTVGFISETFSDYYYYDEENQWLDGAVQAIHRTRNPQKKADMFYCLYQACLQKRPFNLFHRKNLYLRKNCNRDTKFGNWRTWEKSFSEHIEKASIELIKAKNIESGKADILPPGDASEIPANFDLVYIDPPYLKQTGSGNSLNYLDRYHFLEGMADYKRWSTRICYSKKNRPLEPIQAISDWNNKAKFKEKLFDLIETHKKSIVVLSYSTNGYPTTEEITRHFEDTFNDVVVLRKKLPHALKKNENEEISIIGVAK